MITKINKKVAVGVISYLLPLTSYLFFSLPAAAQQDSTAVSFVDQVIEV